MTNREYLEYLVERYGVDIDVWALNEIRRLEKELAKVRAHMEAAQDLIDKHDLASA